jgi:Ca2+-binding EF-hand superfamily protein
MFRKYDTDYSGYLTADELFMALTKEVGVVLLKEELI